MLLSLRPVRLLGVFASALLITLAVTSKGGAWSSPFPSYTLTDGWGQVGYHRISISWTSWNSNYTIISGQNKYVNIPSPYYSDRYECYYLSYSAPYSSNIVWKSLSNDGWYADYVNTPQWLYAPWSTSVTGGIEWEAGAAKDPSGWSCYFQNTNNAAQAAYIGFERMDGCYWWERYPAYTWSLGSYCYY